MRLATLLLSLAVPSAALANDQCLSLPKDKAQAARKAVEGKKVIFWKASSGQAKPVNAKSAKKVKVATVRPGEDKDAFEVHFDGPAMDMAFVYVEESAKKYRNVAALIECPTKDVEPLLELK